MAARDELWRPDEQADLAGCDPLAEPGLDGLADCVVFGSGVGEAGAWRG